MDRGLKGLVRVLAHIKRNVSPDLPCQQLLIVLCVAESGDEGITYAELGRRLAMPEGSVSKHISLRLSVSIDRGTGQVKGLDFVRAEQDLAEKRRFRVYLTGKGQGFVKEISKLMSEGRGGGGDEEKPRRAMAC